MRTARHYLAREIYRSTTVVLVALVGLFMFFALIEGLDKVGDRLSLLNLFYLQALDLPNHLYELLPIGLLIGAVLALAGLAQRNELTILRASGVSGLKLLGTLWLITIPLVLGAYILSEYITPAAELRGSESRLSLLGRTDGGRLSSGYWFKEGDDESGTRIINIHQLNGQGQVQGIVLYEFLPDDTLKAYVQAKAGQFEQGRLTLQDLTETRILPQSTDALADGQIPKSPVTEVLHLDHRSITTSLSPERLIARILTPERMAISDLLDYIQYLRNNHLQSDRQEVALWRKIAYPFTLLVMITIAAPIGFMQTRRGGVGPKVFMGIILGVGFFMLNQLALNAGMLGDWSPWATALVPSLLGLGLALLALLAMEHRHPLALWWRQRRLEKIRMTGTRDVWVIGDVQGCSGALHALLAHPELSRPEVELWFAGDLVNRGPDSLGALRLIRQLGPKARTVLGNHDLHLLAVVSGVRKPGKSDTFQDILDAPDRDELITWLRHRPLMVRDRGHTMVHAGILPAWTLDQAQSLAREIETALQQDDWPQAVHDLYGEEPLQWDDALRGPARMRVIVNALTRMRVCHADGSMDFRHKGGPNAGPALHPWFDLPGRRDLSEPVVFGHWSALGLNIRPDSICLDTGCVWGRSLTALRLSDHQLIQQDCADCR